LALFIVVVEELKKGFYRKGLDEKAPTHDVLKYL